MIQPLPPASHFEWRVRFMGAGAIIALVGMYFEISWMVWVAIGVLALGVLMRFVGRQGDAAVDPVDDEAESDS